MKDHIVGRLTSDVPESLTQCESPAYRSHIFFEFWVLHFFSLSNWDFDTLLLFFCIDFCIEPPGSLDVRGWAGWGVGVVGGLDGLLGSRGADSALLQVGLLPASSQSPHPRPSNTQRFESCLTLVLAVWLWPKQLLFEKGQSWLEAKLVSEA